MKKIRAWLKRIDDVERRLSTLARPIEGLTSPDPKTQEQWEDGQVWGHLSEFVDFWIPQVQKVIDNYSGDPVPFGRDPADTRKADSLEAGKSTPPEVSWARLQDDLVRLRQFVASLDSRALAARGLHRTIGVMDIDAMMKVFLVGHLEEHAEQLESLG